MNLNDWAITWGVPAVALADLRRRMGLDGGAVSPAAEGKTEAYSQSLVRLESSHLGIRLMRNNVGALPDETGRPVRYGLMNDSKALNEKIKSSDLIGIDPRPIPVSAVGTPWGRFVAREMKAPGWLYTGTDREVAQLAFLNMVVSLGGDGAFATGEGSFT